MSEYIEINPAYTLKEVEGKFGTPEMDIHVLVSSLSPMGVLTLAGQLLTWAIKNISNYPK